MLELPNLGDFNIPWSPPTASGPRSYPLKHISDNTFSLQIDNSTLEAYSLCPRLAEFKNVYGRRSHSNALIYGGAIHAGLEVWYKHPRSFMSLDEKANFLSSEVYPAILNYFGDYSPDLNEWRTPERALETMAKYIRTYDSETFDVYKFDDKPAVEIGFSLPLMVLELDPTPSKLTVGQVVEPGHNLDPDSPLIIDTVQIYWTGKIDLFIQMNEGLFILDHKTTSIAGQGFFSEFELSQQTIGYCWAAEQIINQPVKGLLLNAIVGRKPTPTGKSLEFLRQRFYYRPDQITEWKWDVVRLVQNYVHNLQHGEFPRITKNCITKYGACSFHQVCQLPADMRKAVLFSDAYENNDWSPLK